MSTLIDGFLAYQAPAGKQILKGASPAIAIATYPNGTPIATTPVVGRRFNLYGLKPNGTSNAADVYIGASGSGAQLQQLSPGTDGAVGAAVGIALSADDGGLIDLQKYYMGGTDGDGVQYLRIE